MQKNRTNKRYQKKVTKIHWIWIVLAVLAIAIPLTIFISSQNTDNRQHASKLMKKNGVKDLVLSGECKNNRKNGQNTFRRARYVCSNGETGMLANNKNTCDKRAEWMTKAERKCRTKNSNPPPPPLGGNPPPVDPPPPMEPTKDTVIQCPVYDQVITPPGTTFAVRLLNTHGQPLVGKNVLLVISAPNFYSTGDEWFPTDSNGYARINFPVEEYGEMLSGSGKLIARYTDLAAENPNNEVKCTSTFHYRTP